MQFSLKRLQAFNTKGYMRRVHQTELIIKLVVQFCLMHHLLNGNGASVVKMLVFIISNPSDTPYNYN